MIAKIDDTKCTGCGICVESCALDTLRLDPDTGKAYIAYPDDCMTCFTCELRCPENAIDVHPFKEPLPLAIEYPVGGEGHG